MAVTGSASGLDLGALVPNGEDRNSDQCGIPETVISGNTQFCSGMELMYGSRAAHGTEEDMGFVPGAAGHWEDLWMWVTLGCSF